MDASPEIPNNKLDSRLVTNIKYYDAALTHHENPHHDFHCSTIECSWKQKSYEILRYLCVRFKKNITIEQLLHWTSFGTSCELVIYLFEEKLLAENPDELLKVENEINLILPHLDSERQQKLKSYFAT